MLGLNSFRGLTLSARGGSLALLGHPGGANGLKLGTATARKVPRSTSRTTETRARRGDGRASDQGGTKNRTHADIPRTHLAPEMGSASATSCTRIQGWVATPTGPNSRYEPWDEGLPGLHYFVGSGIQFWVTYEVVWAVMRGFGVLGSTSDCGVFRGGKSTTTVAVTMWIGLLDWN
jgi:hypothetical protein